MSRQIMIEGFADGVSKNETKDSEVCNQSPARRVFSQVKAVNVCRSGSRHEASRTEGATSPRRPQSSTVARWRRKRDEGVLGGLAPKKRGPKPAAVVLSPQPSTRAQTNIDPRPENEVKSDEQF